MGGAIRWRMTIWYGALTLVTLMVMAATVLALVRHSLVRAADDRLRAHHEGLARFASSLDVGLSDADVRDEYREYADVSLANGVFELVDAAGRALATPDLAEWRDVSRVATARAPQDVAVDVVLAGQPYRASARDFAARGERFRAVIAVPMGPADAALATARQLIFWLLPIMTLAAAGVGYLVSARALRPLDAMTDAARSITVDHLDARLAVPAANDELQRLAITFNGMLDRLQSGVGNIARFTSEASHELRTPVTIVRTTAELALRRERTPTEYRHALGEIHAQACEMSALVDDLLAMARADAGVDVASAAVCDVCTSVASFAASWRWPTPAPRLTLPDAPLCVRAESREILRLLSIVCENAVKYATGDADAAGLAIRVRGTSSAVILEVEDHGVGVHPADLPRIFERFYRGAAARASTSEGSGLGLPIAQMIAHRLGGTITVMSPACDSTDRPGTLVTITLPRAVAVEAHA